MTFVVASRRASAARLRQTYAGAQLIDVTSKGEDPWVRFSPFYPHGSIPVPLSEGYEAMSVEGIWQALKVFDHADVDLTKMHISSMTGLKRSARSFGQVLGHRAGIQGKTLLDYHTARQRIYLPAYRWVLDHRLGDLIVQLRHLDEESSVVLLDYETNADIDDLTRPLSHASLIVRYLTGTWPPPHSVKQRGERGALRLCAGGRGAGLYAGGGNAVHSEQDLRGVPSQKTTLRAVCPILCRNSTRRGASQTC